MVLCLKYNQLGIVYSCGFVTSHRFQLHDLLKPSDSIIEPSFQNFRDISNFSDVLSVYFLHILNKICQLLLDASLKIVDLLSKHFVFVEYFLNFLSVLVVRILYFFVQQFVLLCQLLNFIMLLLYDVFILLNQSLSAALGICVRIRCDDRKLLVIVKLVRIILASQNRCKNLLKIKLRTRSPLISITRYSTLRGWYSGPSMRV